uniref:Putative homeobox transcription factor sip1 n=1 Tax=Ixodes ricinus TaxID=34613 RepID=A0A6B0UQ04_IXORI
MTGQKGIISKLLGAKLALKWLFTFVLLSVAEHLGLRARHGNMLALGLFITVGSQVAHNYTLITGDIGAGTAPKPDVLGDFQWAAGLTQQCGSITQSFFTFSRLLSRMKGFASNSKIWSLMPVY